MGTVHPYIPRPISLFTSARTLGMVDFGCMFSLRGAWLYLVLFLAIRGWGRDVLTEELSCPNALGTGIDDSHISQMRAGDTLNRQVITMCESYCEPGTIPGPGACNSKQADKTLLFWSIW